MNHLPFTLTAYFFNALSVLGSKFLLNKTIPNPLVYIFYISLISLLAIFAIPFTKIPNPETFIMSSISTLLWTFGAYFMFKALKSGQVSRVIPIIGTLIPVILLIFASNTSVIASNQIWAIIILIAGMIVLTVSDWGGKINKKEILFELLSASFFAISYILLRQAYLNSDFFSVIVWSRLILLPLGIILLAIPSLRRQIITSSGPRINFFSKTGLIFLGGQGSGAVSEFLLLFSISLANPALVNSLQGVQYVFLLIFGIFFFKEKYTPFTIITKIVGIVLLGIGLFLLISPL